MFRLTGLALTLGLVVSAVAIAGCSDDDGSAADDTEANESAYYEAFLAGDLEGVMATFSEDPVFEDQTFGDLEEGEAEVRSMEQAVIGLTDREGSEIIDRFVSVDGTRAVAVFRWTGTNAEGEAFDLPTVVVHEYDGDKIAKESIYYAAPDAVDQLVG